MAELSVSPNLASSARRPAIWGLSLALGAALFAAAVDQALRPRIARSQSPLGAAAWIWSADSSREVVPRILYFVKDFDCPPGVAAARLLVQGDEEYVLYLNGRIAGSNGFRLGAPLDHYEVGELLSAGGNRLVAEVRSSLGVGGLLVRLDIGPGTAALAVSDGSWRIFRQLVPGLVGGWLPLAGAEPAMVWGVPPLGRWGRPRLGQPQLAEALVDPPFARLLPRTATPVPELGGRAVLFDFGAERAGYLVLHAPAEVRSPALLFFGSEPPDPNRRGADAILVESEGASEWRDARLRRLRYALVWGLAAGSWLELLEPQGDRARGLGTDPPAGVFGLTPPVRVEPLEAEIRRRVAAGAEKP